MAVTEPILMEVLAGAKTDKRHEGLRRLLFSFEWIPCDPLADFEGAARLYRSRRHASWNHRLHDLLDRHPYVEQRVGI